MVPSALRAQTLATILAVVAAVGTLSGLGLAMYSLLHPPPPPAPPAPGVPASTAQALIAANQQMAASVVGLIRSGVRTSAMAVFWSLAILALIVLSSRWRRLDEWWKKRQAARWHALNVTRPALTPWMKSATGLIIVGMVVTFSVAQWALVYDAYRQYVNARAKAPNVANLSGVGSSIAVAAMLWSSIALAMLVHARTFAVPPWLCKYCLYDRDGLDADAVCPECGRADLAR